MSQKKTDADELIGITEASHILRISVMTVRRWSKQGLLQPAVSITAVGSAYRRGDVEKLAAEKRKGPKQAKAEG